METEVKEVVTIRVVETIKGRPRVLNGATVVLTPVFDLEKGTGALKTGITREDWEANYKAQFGDYDKFYSNFQIVLGAKTRSFDTSEPLNRLKIALMKSHPWLAATEAEITKDTLFIIFDEVEEAKKENTKFEYELKAYKFLYDMSATDRAQFLKLFGVKNTEKVSSEVILKRLKDKATENPKKFVEMYEDKSKEFKILLEDLLSSRIVKRIGGVYYYGNKEDGISMGITPEQAIEFMKDPKNSDLMLQIKRMSEPKPKKETKD